MLANSNLMFSRSFLTPKRLGISTTVMISYISAPNSIVGNLSLTSCGYPVNLYMKDCEMLRIARYQWQNRPLASRATPLIYHYLLGDRHPANLRTTRPSSPISRSCFRGTHDNLTARSSFPAPTTHPDRCQWLARNATRRNKVAEMDVL